MNKITKRVLAAIAASVMTVTAVSPSVYANFSDEAVIDGWVKEGNTERRYIDGLPYTGWLLNEDGTKKYCLEGYLMTGNFLIEGKSYTFGKDGILSKNGTVPSFSAECGEVDPDTNRIELTVYSNNDDGKKYSTGNPEKMERWQKGKWVDCLGKDTEYSVNDLACLFDHQYSNKVYFYPQAYTNNNLKEGYYRITLSAREENNSSAANKKFYAIIHVTPRNNFKDGFIHEGTLTRRYSKGVPYTGWSYLSSSAKKYYLDGYPVTGELQIDKYIYTFNDEGICTDQKYPVLSASCGDKISADTGRVDINISLNINNGDEYWAVDPVSVKRWEYGRWTECKRRDTGYVTDDCLAEISYSKNGTVHFYPQEYTGSDFRTGYYKIDLSAHNIRANKGERFSAMFEVVPYAVIKNGWVWEGGAERRYKDGKAYTGWVETNNGKKYCYDGYVVTGEFQIGKYIYYFNADGIYTGIRRDLVITASCGNAVASNSQTIVITVKNNGTDGRNYTVGYPYKMERWENGKWVSCKGNGVRYTIPLGTSAIYAKSGSGRSTYTTMDFYPQTYTAGSFTPGYYRIMLFGSVQEVSGVSAGTAVPAQEIYAMFEVV